MSSEVKSRLLALQARYETVLNQKVAQFETAAITRLQSENDQLRCKVSRLKTDLCDLETTNGLVQVPLPTESSINKMKAAAGGTPTVPLSAKPHQANAVKLEDKPKKDSPKKQQQNKGGKANVKAEEKEPDISMLDLRIGKIVCVEKHPDADSLYFEKVDVGGEKLLTVCSGLVKHVSLESLQDRCAIFLINLKPAKMRGIASEAMIICAGAVDDSKVEVVDVPKDAKPGDKVLCATFQGEPLKQIDAKKKTWPAIQADMKTNSERVACYRGEPFYVESLGASSRFLAPTISNGILR